MWVPGTQQLCEASRAATWQVRVQHPMAVSLYLVTSSAGASPALRMLLQMRPERVKYRVTPWSKVLIGCRDGWLFPTK